MIKLYHCADARSFRPLWALEELRLDYELVVMPFPPRYRAKEFMQVNPLGTIPALVDGETFMTESAATVQYLVTRYGPSELAVPVDDPAYGAWLNWLHFGEATLTFPQTLVLRYRQFEPGKAEVVAEDYAKWFLARLKAVDRALDRGEHLCAGRFTAADISVGYALLLAENIGLAEGFSPAAAAYWARLQARPGFQAAKAAQVSRAPEGAGVFLSEGAPMITLYDHPLSPYAQKVKIALREKGLAFETPMPGGLGAGGAQGDFVEASPRAEVPALVDGDVRVFDSTIILEYLDDAYPEPAMRPASAAERARVRMLEEVMDTHFEAINWGLSEIRWFRRAEGAQAEALQAAARRQTEGFFAWLEKQLGEREWFNGDSFGWGDLSVVPYLNGSVGQGNPPAEGSKLAAWLARANGRPSVQACVADIAALNTGAGMPDVAKLVEQGLFKREYRDHRLEWMIKSGGVEVVLKGLERGNIRFAPDFG